MDKIYEQQFRKERKEEDRKKEDKKEKAEEENKEEESTWECVARFDGVGSSKKKEGSGCQGIPRPAIHVRKITGRTGCTSYELSKA